MTPFQRVDNALDLLIDETDLEDPIEVSVSVDALISALSRAFPKAAFRHSPRSALPSVLKRLAEAYGLNREVLPVAQRISDTTRVNTYTGTLPRATARRLTDDVQAMAVLLREFLKTQEAA